MKIKYSVQGMACMMCVSNIKNSLSEMPDVKNSTISLEGNYAIVESNIEIPFEKINEQIKQNGFNYEFSNPQILV